MLLNNRVIFSDNGTISDISNEMSDILIGSKVIPVVAAEDYLYLGSEMPFNHRYISIKSANATTSVVSVHLWNGDEWKAAVDVQDFTKVGGATLGQSGHIMWALDPDYTWSDDDTNYNGNTVTGLTSAKIYGLYWARISFSADLTSTTEIKYVGHKFAEDLDLRAIYPDLVRANVMDQFVKGKSSWEEQHVLAAEYIIKDLVRKKIAWSGNQILDYRTFTEAAVYRLASIIFNALGKDYFENMKDAEVKYYKALDLGQFNLDKNADTKLERSEIKTRTGYLHR